MTVDLTGLDGLDEPISLDTHLESVAHQLLIKVAQACEPETALQFLELFKDVRHLLPDPKPEPKPTATTRKTTSAAPSKEI